MVMKKAIVIVLCACVLIPGYAFSETITLASDCWRPYICGNGPDKYGISIDITKMIFEEAGYQVQFSDMPWKRAVSLTRKGNYSAIVCAAKNDALDFIFPEVHVVLRRTCFYTHEKSQWIYDGLGSLMDVSIGIVAGYHYFDALDNYIEKQKDTGKIQIAHGKNAMVQNVLKLKAERIHAYPADPYVLQYTMFQLQLSGIRKAGCAPGETKLYIAFSPALPQSTQYAAIFSEGMRQLIASGRIIEIYAKYGIDY